MISIIIPYWNAAKWIERCIKSMLQPGNFEFIFVNDNSDDNSTELAIKCANNDPRFIFIDNFHKKGVGGARNSGLDKAKGEWISFLDVDDELIPDASRQFELSIYNFPNGNIIQLNHLRYVEEKNTTISYCTNNYGTYKLNNLPKCFYGVWNKIIRKEFIETHQIRFIEDMQYGEDEVFILDCLSYDNNLYHTPKHINSCIRHFDNSESLSQLKAHAPERLIQHARAIEDFILRTHNKEAKRAACQILASHWNSKTYVNNLCKNNYKYIIMCGGTYTIWGKPKQLLKINGEEIVARTIRLLRENGIENISISSNNPIFEKFGVPVLQHDNHYYTRGYNDSDGYWCNAFYPTDVPTCYLFGDVIYSPAAIKKIIETDTDDIEFFGSMPPFALNYPKQYVEPFAFKVVNNEHLREAIEKTKELDKTGAFNRQPIAWELWQVIKNTPLNKQLHNYIPINDYTCDIDTPEEIEKIQKLIEKETK